MLLNAVENSEEKPPRLKKMLVIGLNKIQLANQNKTDANTKTKTKMLVMRMDMLAIGKIEQEGDKDI